MEKIDLAKCVNCRFRAKVDGKEKTGRIQVIDGCIKFWFDYHNELNDIIHHAVHMEHYRLHGIGDFFDDFEIVPRDPETYKDWQVGDRVCDNKHRNVSREVIFRSGELVVMKTNANTACSNYTCDELFGCGFRLVLTDIERQIIEEKRKQKYEPQDGDICYVEDSDGYCSIFIYKNGYHRTNYYASLDADRGCSKILFTEEGHVLANSKITVRRPAKEEQQQMLFDAMAKAGKRWNAERKVVEDIPEPYEFRKGEPVLVRDNGHVWKIGVFTKMRTDYFRYGAMTNGLDECGYRFCIPYNERTMHLLGTAEDYREGE